MRLIIQPDALNMSKWAANYIASKIIKAKPTAEKPFVLGLPTGSTPEQTYAELVKLNKEGVVSFENVVTFNMDEYVGLERDHPQSYYSFMREHFFDHVDIKEENINVLDGMTDDLDAECAAYEEAIKRVGGIDLFLGGVGLHGHLAFNEPGSSLASRTRMKNLTPETVIANSKFFMGSTTDVPTKVLTVGIGTILDAHEVVILISGLHKARALYHAVEGAVNHMWTISALQQHQRGMIVCDYDACTEIRVGTYRYFLSNEEGNLDPASLLKGLD